MARTLIAITGGIGAGKSVVSEILRVSGCYVYDCDDNAKRLMDSDARIKSRIINDIDPRAINADGSINRPLLSDIVFADKDKLATLNHIVHSAVFEDIAAQKRQCSDKILFVESAILYTSGLWRQVDEIWEVTADIETRVARVMRRNNLPREQVLRRIHSQSGEQRPSDCTLRVYTITNDDTTALLPQVWSALSERVGDRQSQDI